MKKNVTLILFCFFVSPLLWSCQIQGIENTTSSERKIPVVTTHDVLTIHTKMIARDDVFVVTLDNNKKYISNSGKELLSGSDVIISDAEIEKSSLATALQNYKGTYVNAGKPQIPHGILSQKDEIEHITAIRDVFAEINPKRRGVYYDNAGNYIHLLEDTYSKLKERIQLYNQFSFIIVGQNLDYFLSDFELQKHNAGILFLEWKTKNQLLDEAKLIREKQKIGAIFADAKIPTDILSALRNETGWAIYILPELEEDTSGWWYIRYIEKMINIFVSAFDTYD